MTPGQWIMLVSVLVLIALGIAAAMFGEPKEPEE